MKINIFWFRRDLRLSDNTALNRALSAGLPVLPLFIFDEHILQELSKDDPRVSFIYQCLQTIHQNLRKRGSGLLCLKGEPLQMIRSVLNQYKVAAVYVNKDYEPYARQRDRQVTDLLKQWGIPLFAFKDQVMFEESEIIKADGKPYTVYTPYKIKWLQAFTLDSQFQLDDVEGGRYCAFDPVFPAQEEIGFKESAILPRPYNLSRLDRYVRFRDFPDRDATSYLGPHLRFGTVSIRQLLAQLQQADAVFLSQLIWREFFMQILYHFPGVVDHNFKPKYDGIRWRNNPQEFDQWCRGATGYPMVDAGMRELNATGYMHNRVRMLTASFLCKHLLIDWRWGEAYFAGKLLDYELASNNGNWQWAAGTGCDAAPYFRVFNPAIQFKKFDPSGHYVRKWVPEYGSVNYSTPMVDHKMARKRALEAYKSALAEHV